jgi:putative transposase
MARPLRITYPGAWYHVMNRGRSHTDIFLEEGDYRLFLEILRETVIQWNLEVAAYCLMRNHYHLLVRTPEGNISRCMRHLNGVYTQRFNRRHGIDGTLFRGRYKSVLVEADSHLLELLRYIHRNPLKAKITARLDEYPWSSHQGYLAGHRRWGWLARASLLTMFSRNRKQAFAAYLNFVQQPDSAEIDAFLAKEKRPPVLGSAHFTEKIRNQFGGRREDSEIPESQMFKATFPEVLAAVCQVCQVCPESIDQSRRGQVNLARDLVIYSMRKHSRQTLQQIGAHLAIEKYSSVSSAVQRIKKRRQGDMELAKCIAQIDQQLTKAKSRLDPMSLLLEPTII